MVDINLQEFIEDNVTPADWPASLARPASLQLLKQSPFDPDYDVAGEMTDHDDFYAELATLNDGRGYPVETQNVGVSFGNDSPNPDQSGEWLDINFNPFIGICVGCSISVDLQDDPAMTQPGSLLPLDQTNFRTRVGGGLIVVDTDRERDPTFIPYDSALDIQPDGSSPFTIRLDAGNQGPSFHDEVPTDLVAPLLNTLGYALPPPSSVSVLGPSSASGGEDLSYRAVTPNPNATYSYTWEWRAFLSPGGGGSEAHGASTGGPTTQYVPSGVWHQAPTTGAVFAHSFPCGAQRGEVRVTATGGGATVASPIRQTQISGCGGSGGAFSEGGSSDKTGAAPPGALALSAAHPNPASDHLRFNVQTGAEAVLNVYDTLGRSVFTRQVQTGPLALDVAGFAPGIYVARLSTDRAHTSRRFTVSR